MATTNKSFRTKQSVISEGDVEATGILISSNSAANEGGEIQLALPSSGSTLSGSVKVDIYQNKIRFFESGGTNRGAYIDLSSASATAGSNLLSGGGGTTTNALTIGTGLSGTSFNGSAAVTIAIDSTVATLTGSQTLTNKTLTDSTTYFQDQTDNTKKLQFELSGITTSTTRTLTIPDASGTIALTASPTFTGTVTAPYFAASDNGNGTNFKVGDDVWLGDINIANTMSVKGQQSSASGYIRFGSDTNGFGYNGTSLVYGTTVIPAAKTLVVTTDKLSALASTTSAEFATVISDEIGTGNIILSDLATNAQTASYTLVLGDKGKLVEISNASANNLTVPLNSTVAFPIGTQINILQTGAGQTTVVATGGVTINATPGLKLRTQWSSATLIKRATDTWVLVGDISA